VTETVQTMTIAVDTRVGERWIRGTTTASVVLLACIAAVVSYGHMHMLTVVHGESARTAALIPLSVDGMIVASSMTLLADSRTRRSGGGVAVDAAGGWERGESGGQRCGRRANRVRAVIAAWPSFALIGAYELLMRQIRSQLQLTTPHPAPLPPPTAAWPRLRAITTARDTVYGALADGSPPAVPGAR